MDPIQPTDIDQQLLLRFTDHGDEAAFRRLVERHAPMVRGVALRCTGDGAVSDEVAQSVFFLLARRADTLSAEYLAGWLHRTAFLTACNARRKSLRYQQALRDLSQHKDVMTDSTNSDARLYGAAWEEIQPYLDEAVARLPERVRKPVIMRFFESRSIREIAIHSGKSEAAVRKLLERALHRISDWLRSRGIITNGTSLGVLLAAQSLLAPPTSAAGLAASALSASQLASFAVAPVGPLSFLGSGLFGKCAAVGLLLAALPMVLLWQENHQLKQGGGTLSEQTRTPSPPLANKDNLYTDSAALDQTDKAPSPEKITETKAKKAPASRLEKSQKDAAREMTRMSLYLPGLTTEQRTRLLTVLEDQSLRRVEASEKARQTGAFTRLADGIKNLTEADRALFKAAHTAPGALSEDDNIFKSLLTVEQYELHLAAFKRRCINDAESVAADTLNALGLNFDLSPEQKDAIFQGVAHFEMNPPTDGSDDSADLPSPFREAGRDRVIRTHLTTEQATLFEQWRAEERQQRKQFLQTLQPPS
jgi:RNA polymerase sigma factor (sigma-70 family)